ncbi:MAG TPA: M13 family metallopeptidase [Pararobbsia sp.]|nr:M13 family metallopeptidase [Pararobbsia sp.]
MTLYDTRHRATRRLMRTLRYTTTAWLLGSTIAYAHDNASFPRSGIFSELTLASVRPQDDLYRAAAGGTGEVTLPDDTTETTLRNGIVNAANTHAAPGTPTQRIGDLYASYMDEGKIEALGTTPLRDDFARIDAMRSPQDVAAIIGYLATIGVPAPFDIRVTSEGHIGRFKAVIAFANDDPDTEASLRRLPEQERLAVRWFELYGDAQARQHAVLVTQLRRDLINARAAAKQSSNGNTPISNASVNAPVSIGDDFPWKDYFVAAGLANRTREVSSPHLAQVKAAANALARAPLDAVRAYLKYAYISHHFDYLPERFKQAFYDYANYDDETDDREALGIEMVTNLLGDEVKREYLPPTVSPEQRAYIESMFAQVNQVVREKALNASWLPEQRRALVLRRLDTVTIRIGGGDHVDYRHLVIARDDLFGNVRRARRLRYNHALLKLDMSPNDRAAPSDDDDHARYWCNINRVNLPNGYIEGLDIRRDVDAANYGSLGSVLGHELIHAIESPDDCEIRIDRLRAEDPPGNARVETMKRELIAQYTYSTASGHEVGGEQTLAENIADLAGLDAAYLAYKRSLGARVPSVINGLTGDQRFFYAFAQSQRTNTEEDSLQFVDDNHSAALRVNTLARNVQGFYDAFDVRPGDKTYLPPERRVTFY